MSAQETALQAYQVALAAHQQAEDERQAEEERERRRRQQQEERDRAEGWVFLQEAGVPDWFPGESWDLMAFGHIGQTIWAPQDRSFRLAADSDGVSFVEPASDRDTGYTYWSGPKVASAADIGRCLAQRQTRD